MKVYKSIMVALILSLSLFSCTKLQQLTTYSTDEMKSAAVKPTGFDAATKVGWTSYNDSTHLYFSVDLLDSRVQMSVLSRGLTIYIDTTAKLKETTNVTYPLIRRAPGTNRSTGRQQNNSGQENPIAKMLENSASMELRWTQGENSYVINPALDNSEFVTMIAMDSLNYVSLLIGVPMTLIHPQGIDGINELSVGFGIPMVGGRQGVSGAPGAQQSMGSTGGGRSGGGRSGGGGGRGGGGGGGRGGGGQMGGAQMGGMSSSGPTLEKFWYRTTLRK